ncbi:hypothetical protein [Novosphingobium olei]|uniref:Uncharacterized protein n=1 Tax=Novosphingobium olei TaxID=2728851 RepID=A0A7Y0GB43_9SPHN|nr:hypothetical protein [Novosphingobium olei]NML94252.1 hypothetical protein [Novosphingobium olei]BEV00760.1 hypothetical protein NSDW_18540 [Novosphingobium olei]
MNLYEAWLTPSWKSARPLNEADERFRELLGDLGPAMPGHIVGDLSQVYLDTLLRTSVPSWLRARLVAERDRRARGLLLTWYDRARAALLPSGGAPSGA